jgi:hypothetical protein
MTHEENEDMQNHLSKLDSQINKLNDRSMKKIDLINTQIEIERNMEENKELMERKMDENKEQTKRTMEQLE